MRMSEDEIAKAVAWCEEHAMPPKLTDWQRLLIESYYRNGQIVASPARKMGTTFTRRLIERYNELQANRATKGDETE